MTQRKYRRVSWLLFKILMTDPLLDKKFMKKKFTWK